MTSDHNLPKGTTVNILPGATWGAYGNSVPSGLATTITHGADIDGDYRVKFNDDGKLRWVNAEHLAPLDDERPWYVGQVITESRNAPADPGQCLVILRDCDADYWTWDARSRRWYHGESLSRSTTDLIYQYGPMEVITAPNPDDEPDPWAPGNTIDTFTITTDPGNRDIIVHDRDADDWTWLGTTRTWRHDDGAVALTTAHLISRYGPLTVWSNDDPRRPTAPEPDKPDPVQLGPLDHTRRIVNVILATYPEASGAAILEVLNLVDRIRQIENQ